MGMSLRRGLLGTECQGFVQSPTTKVPFRAQGFPISMEIDIRYRNKCQW